MLSTPPSRDPSTGTTREQPNGFASYLEVTFDRSGIDAAIFPDEEDSILHKEEKSAFARAMQGVKKI
jgi:hypothetical protein